MVRSSMATRERPLASNRERTSPTSPRRTVSGLRRTRVRCVMGRTLPSGESGGATAYVLGDGPDRVRVRDRVAGHPPQRHVPAPDTAGDVLRLVDRAAGTDLERGLVEGDGEDR